MLKKKTDDKGVSLRKESFSKLPILKKSEFKELTERGDVYVTTVYDRIGREVFTLVYMKNLDLTDRMFLNTTKNMNLYEFEVYVLGILNTETLEFKHINAFLDTSALKTKYMENSDATS